MGWRRTPRRTAALTAAVALAVLAGCGGEPPTAAPPPPPTATATTAPPATPAPTAVAPPPLPIPEPLPTDPWAPTPEVVLGTIELPTLGVREPLGSGMTLTAINRGPGHWPGTAMPGQLGNAVIAGHRTTYSQPFHRLDELRAGDPVVFTMADGSVFTYEVRGVIVVPEAHIGIAAQSRAHTATLFACHPKGLATHRVAAKLRLLGPDGSPVDADEALPPVDQGSDPVAGTTLLTWDPTVDTSS